MNGILISHANAQTATSILLFGDSIIAGYGLAQESSLSAQLEIFFREKGKDVKVINGGVSGDTTTSARGRLEWTLDKYKPDVVFLALGGNDVLRGFSPTITRDNLDAMLTICKKRNIKVVLSAVRAPANLGLEYMGIFNKIYPDLADKYNAPLYPFLLEKTFGNQTLMQSDGIHPTAEGIKSIANELGPYLLKKVLR